MKTLAEHIKEDRKHFDNRSILLTHFISVPLAFFAIFIPLSWLQFSIIDMLNFNFAWIGILALFVYYLFLDIPMAFVTGVAMVILGLFASSFSLYTPNASGFYIFLVCIIVAVVLQFTNKGVKGKKPHFWEHPKRLLVAPIVTMSEVLFRFGLCRSLKTQVGGNATTPPTKPAAAPPEKKATPPKAKPAKKPAAKKSTAKKKPSTPAKRKSK